MLETGSPPLSPGEGMLGTGFVDTTVSSWGGTSGGGSVSGGQAGEEEGGRLLLSSEGTSGERDTDLVLPR